MSNGTESSRSVIDRPAIKGLVARVLNSRELVINKGRADGVKVGMIFHVKDRKAEDIPDPETGDVLGSVNRPKVDVKIVSVEDNLAIARTFRSRQVNVGGILPDISPIFLPPKFERRYETLKTDESTWEELDEDESFVKVGDPVEEVLLQTDSPDSAEVAKSAHAAA